MTDQIKIDSDKNNNGGYTNFITVKIDRSDVLEKIMQALSVYKRSEGMSEDNWHMPLFSFYDSETEQYVAIKVKL
jgi:hypothetical protein